MHGTNHVTGDGRDGNPSGCFRNRRVLAKGPPGSVPVGCVSEWEYTLALCISRPLCGTTLCPGVKEEPIRSFLLLGLLAVLQPGAADPRVGTWTLIAAQSSLDPPNRLSVTLQHDSVHVVMTGETHLDFTADLKGHQSPAPGNLAFNEIELRKIDKRQAEVEEKKNGAMVGTIREQLSPDGNELTITTSAKNQADQIAVWRRTGGPRVARELFAGEWTEDLSKSRLRQGLVLKIEMEGGASVHFLGDSSYTARFDGKQYDVRNSRNDTVALELLDPHTVEALYRRDDQITQKDNWLLSADGQKLTLTSAGTLETGQRLTEKLLFKRQ